MATFNQIANEFQTKSPEERLKAIQGLQSSTQKRFGKESITILDGKVNLDIPNIPTDIMSLDLALGIGGLPRGRIIEIYGPESSGKTTLCLNQISQTQKRGGIASFIDAEHSFSPKWAKKQGVDVSQLLVSQPDCGEEALEIAESLIESNMVNLLIIDSVAALVPRAELEKDMGESSMGLQARLLSQACRKLVAMVSKTGTTVIFINQLRDNIGGYGPAQTTTGGNALKFYASVRIDVRKKEVLKKGDEATGVKTGIKIVKNKVANPFTECTFDFYFDTGYDRVGSIIEEAVKYDLVKKGGAWFTYNEEKIQGLNGMKEFLKNKPEILTDWRSKILEIVASKGLSDEEVQLEDDVKRRVPKDDIKAIESKDNEVKTEIEQNKEEVENV